jgi:hypothetical protein
MAVTFMMMPPEKEKEKEKEKETWGKEGPGAAGRSI